MESLKLNGFEVDLFPVPVTRKIQIGDVGEVENWKSSFSYTFDIPKTSKNKQIFDMLATFGSSSRKPFEVITANYIVDTFPLVKNGVAIIREAAETYKANIIDGVKSLAQILQNKTLLDLNLSSLNHNLNATTFTDSFTSTSGYIYGLAHFGRVNDIDIFSDLGYGFTTAVNGDRSVPLEVIINDPNAGARDVINTNDLTGEDGSFYKIVSETSTLTFNVDSQVLFNLSADNTIELRLKQFRSAVLYDNRLIGSVTGLNGESKLLDVDVNEVFNDLDIDDYFILTITGLNTSYNTTIQTHSVEVVGKISYKIEKNLPSIFLHTIVNEIFTQNNIAVEGDFFSTNTDYLNEVVTLSKGFTIDTLNQLIEPGNYLDNIDQIEIIKDVSNRYGLVLIPDDDTYKFLSIDDIMNDRSGAEDWSNKLESIENENYNSGYAQNNTAKFKYAEGAAEDQNGNLEVNNLNADNEKSLFSSIYEIPSIYGLLDIYTRYNIPVWSVDNNGEVSNEETPIKIMSIDKQDININFQMLNDGTIINKATNIPLLSLNKISLQNSIDTYYLKFNSVIDNYLLLEAMFQLSVIDIYNLDFSKLKYLKQTGQYYYLNSVQNTPGQPSKVNLLRV
jgi:uncharacterized protein YkvS